MSIRCQKNNKTCQSKLGRAQCDVSKCLILSDQKYKPQRYSVFYSRSLFTRFWTGSCWTRTGTIHHLVDKKWHIINLISKWLHIHFLGIYARKWLIFVLSCENLLFFLSLLWYKLNIWRFRTGLVRQQKTSEEYVEVGSCDGRPFVWTLVASSCPLTVCHCWQSCFNTATISAWATGYVWVQATQTHKYTTQSQRNYAAIS